MEDVMDSTYKNIDFSNEDAWQLRIRDVKKCMELSNQALEKSREINYEKGIADAERNIGYGYWRMSDYDQSLIHTLKSIEIYKKINDKKGLADALNNLGAVYMFQKDNQKRLEVNKECYKIRTEIDDKDGISSSMNNIGETYMEMEDYENACVWFEKCIDFSKTHTHYSSLAWATFNMGKLLFFTNQKEKCLEYYHQSLKIAEELSYHSLLIELYYYLSKYYLSEGKYNESENYANLSFEQSQIIDNKEGMAAAMQLLSEIYEAQNKYKEALEYFKKYNEYREQYINDSNLKVIQQLEMQYEVNNLKRINEIQKLKNNELLNSYHKIEFEHKELSELFNDLRENIGYAQNIQKNLLQVPESFIQQFPFHFLIYNPKMMVSGDFIWTYTNETDKMYYLAIGDCTGHGVSAALISMLCISHLNNAIKSISEPYKLVEFLNYNVTQSSSNTFLANENAFKPSFEIIVIQIDMNKQLLKFYSTGVEAFYYSQKESAYNILNTDNNNQTIKIFSNDILYVYTDGVYDQLGGQDGKRLKRKNWRDFLNSLIQKPMYAHKNEILQFFNQWKNKEPQTDDITIFGMQI